MKKFSTVVGVKVTEEPKIEVNPQEQKINLIKANLLKLMNDFLKIQATGAARTELVNSAVTITGKEVLADAIIDLVLSEFDSEKVNLLESLKKEMSDWFTLDNKISYFNEKISTQKNQKQINLERKIVTFLELYSDSSDFDIIAENFTNRVKTNSDIENRIYISESILRDEKYNSIPKDKVVLLIEKFRKRIS